MKQIKDKLLTFCSHNIFYMQGRKESLRNLIMLVAETILIFTAISTILIIGLAL